MLTSSLEETLLGVFRFGNTFRIFPGDPEVDWAAICQHEYTHALLAGSTTAGFVHGLLAYLAYRSPTLEMRESWQRVFGAAVTRTRLTHEAAATFTELYERSTRMSRPELYRTCRVPSDYQRYFAVMADMLPDGLSVDVATEVALGICRYCLDVPIDDLVGRSYQELSEVDSGYPPPVDRRFDLVRRILRDNPDFTRQLIEAAASLPLVAGMPGEEPESFYARRRTLSGERNFRVREALHQLVGETIPGRHPRMRFAKDAGDVLESWRAAFAAAGDRALIGYKWTDVDAIDGPDPLLGAVEIVVPNRPLPGLFLAEPDAALSFEPTLITATRAATRCELRPGLALEQGQWYLRYFRVDQDTVAPRVFYSISAQIPLVVVNSKIPLVLVGDASQPASSCPRRAEGTVIRTGAQVTGDILDYASADSSTEYGWMQWPNLSHILVLALYLPSRNELVLCPSLGASA